MNKIDRLRTRPVRGAEVRVTFAVWRRFTVFSGLVIAACGGPKSPQAPPLPDAADVPPVASTGPAASATPAAAPADPNVDAATTAAKAWLALVDDGKYADSWRSGAKNFQSAISSENWVKAVSSVRGPLGKLVSRQPQSAEFKTSLPGVPDGKYVVIRFATVFENKAQAVETVTPSQEADGSWKVAGYFIR